MLASAVDIMRSDMTPNFPSSASTGIFVFFARATTFFVTATFSSNFIAELSIMTDVYPDFMQSFAMSAEPPWSRWRAIGIFSFFVADWIMAEIYSRPIYFTVPSLVCTIIGDLSSDAAEIIDCKVSMLVKLKAPTA